jgi:hypothetical protein
MAAPAQRLLLDLLLLATPTGSMQCLSPWAVATPCMSWASTSIQPKAHPLNDCRNVSSRPLTIINTKSCSSTKKKILFFLSLKRKENTFFKTLQSNKTNLFNQSNSSSTHKCFVQDKQRTHPPKIPKYTATE